MPDTKTELKFFSALESDLLELGVPSDRATLWARAQIEFARKREHKGRPFSMLRLCGIETARKLAELDAAGSAPRAWI